MFQSRGEKKIADILTKYDIPFTYQPAVLVNDNGYQRMWYPDFGLHKYGMFIEYFGVVNNPEYDQRTHHKLQTYKDSEINVIALYPNDLLGNYEKNTIKKIYQNMHTRMSDLEHKITNVYNRNNLYKPKPRFRNSFAMKDKYL